MPGAPLIAAKIAGEKLHFSIRSLLQVSIGYAFLAALAGASVLVIVIVPLVLFSGGGAVAEAADDDVAPGRIAIVGASVAIAAAVSEEIQFRFVLYAILGWIAAADVARLARTSAAPRAVAVTIVQGYLFGLIHLAPVAGTMFHSTWQLLLGGLLMPKRGRESYSAACICAEVSKRR